MSDNSLESIGLRNGTDKSSLVHNYLHHYQAQLGLGRYPVRTVLEIGVLDGASLRTWHEFMPDAVIIGMDIDERCKAFEVLGIKVEIGDQGDVTQLVATAVAHGPFDLIIDDGSHFWSHQILTFETLLPFLRPGGLYILEDIDTSFGHYTEIYGKPGTRSAAQYVARLGEYILSDPLLDLTAEPDLRIRKFVSMIESITYIRRSALIRLRA